MTFNEILNIAPFELDKSRKNKLLTQRLRELTDFHDKHCREYHNILRAVNFDSEKMNSYNELPFLPVRLFKELELKSVNDSEIVKIMTSSGTTGQAVSKIFLDKITAMNQQRAMIKIVSDFTGSERMPMIIIDSPSVIKNRAMFSARGAGILGFSILGTEKIYALDENMQLNIKALREFLDINSGKKILLFGFTFMIWQYFYKALQNLSEKFNLSNGILIHGGGWKKLESESVSPSEFHDKLNEICGLDKIYNYYGMVEQTGCIYMQCEHGNLHASIFQM